MKFTQTDAAKKISSILTRGGKDQQLSDRTIAENIDSLMKALVNDETELDDFIKIVEPMFKTWQSQAKKDNSDFISKWKEEHPDEPKEQAKDGDGSPLSPDMQALLKRIDDLEKLNSENEKNRKLAQTKSILIAKLKEKGVKDEEWIQLQLSKVNFEREFDLDAEVGDYVKLYNKSIANGGNNLPPINPTGGAANNQYAAAIKAAAEMSKKARAVIEQK